MANAIANDRIKYLLDNDYNYEQRDIRFPIITHVNRHEHGDTRTDRRLYHEVLSNATMRIIEERYADDFKMFGYPKMT